MDKLTKLKNAYQMAVDGMKSTLENAAAENLTAEEQGVFDGHKASAESTKQQISNYEMLAKEEAEAKRLAGAPVAALSRQALPGNPANDINGGSVALLDKGIIIPAKAKRWAGRLECFKGADADVQAYKAGMFLAATLCGNRFAQKFCAENGISTQYNKFEETEIQSLQQEGINTAGGFVVFDEYETSIIRLVEEYGLVRRLMRNTPMMSDTLIRPRRTGGVTAYFVGEGEQISKSEMSWDNVKLIAKKLASIAASTNELASDAIIAIADELTREIALAFATKEDLCGFQGDGSSTYGGIVGIVNKLSTLNGVDDGGGLVLASGNLFSEITDADLLKMIGQVPNYPGLRPEWTCSKPFWYQVMARLIRASGGVNTVEMGGELVPVYAGYKVNWTSGTAAMPVSDANSQIACLFGDVRMSAMFGDRAGITIATSTDATVGNVSMFDTDSFAVRGIERFDINVHDVGDATNAGPTVGLITQAS